MKKILSLLVFALMFGACEKYETYDEVDYDYVRNFDVAWNLINENYCFLGYKNIDWDKVYDEYKPRVENAKTSYEFFDIMSDFIDILRDGHAAILSKFDKHGSKYDIEPNGEESPEDYISDKVIKKYLTKKRVTNNGIYYGFIEVDGRQLVYIGYPSFSIEFSQSDLNYIAPMVDVAEGIIVDIRNNPGGVGSYGVAFAERFFSDKTLVGYSAKKNGLGYDDFTEPYEVYVEPASNDNWSHKPTMLLTNRSVYSTANFLTSILKLAPNVTQVGGRSGGGGGLPETYYLPNGWALIFPSNVLLDVQKQHIENGIEPDVEVHISREDKYNEKDVILEKAIELLLND
jgi:C-terminal processing protease CtpA/Prc